MSVLVLPCMISRRDAGTASSVGGVGQDAGADACRRSRACCVPPTGAPAGRCAGGQGFLQGIPGGARCVASSGGRVSGPLSCRIICGALSAFWLSDCSAGRVLCRLPEFYNAPVCVQLHAADFVGVKAAAFHHAGHTMGDSIATGGADGLPHQGRLPYGFAGDDIQGVKKHGSRLLSLCGLAMLLAWAGGDLVRVQPGGGWKPAKNFFGSAKVALKRRFEVPKWHRNGQMAQRI